jgi:hypothetical protein
MQSALTVLIFLLGSVLVKQVEWNRLRLRSQVDMPKFCGAQNISIHGPKDDRNLGNDVIAHENDGKYRCLLGM